ncbi:MAG: hypothetical protein ACRBK7_10420 [Acidimicrobiales bacterium]
MGLRGGDPVGTVSFAVLLGVLTILGTGNVFLSLAAVMVALFSLAGSGLIALVASEDSG